MAAAPATDLGGKQEAAATPALEGDENPILWSRAKKIRNNAILGFATFSLTFGSSALAPALTDAAEYYRVSREAIILGLSLFVLGFAMGPLFLGPASDVFGRRNVYVASYASFAAWSWGAAYAPNYAALIIFRFLAGVSGSSSLNNHPASISDFTTAAQRNRYSAAYAFCAFQGAAVAPLVGGFIVNRAGWRWNSIVSAIVASAAFASIVVGVDESCAPILLYRKYGQLPGTVRPSLVSRMKTALIQPFKLLFTEPVLALVCLYISVLYGLFYGFFAVFPLIYMGVRGWSQEGLALSYIALVLGFSVGTLILRYGQDHAYSRWQKRLPAGQRPPPQARFAMIFWCSWMIPVSLFLIAFCSYRDTHWFGDTLAMALFGCGTLIVFTGLIPFLVDLYLKQAASALAAGVFTRAVTACGFPLFSTQMYRALGIPGASCLLAGIALILTPMPWLFKRYGERLWGHKQVYS